MPIQLDSLAPTLQADILNKGGYDMPNNVRRVIQTAVDNEYYNKIIDAMPSGMVYNTINGAVDDALEGDVIYVHAAPAVYEGRAEVTLDKLGTHLIGAMTSGRTWGTPSIHVHNSDTHNAVQISNHQIELAFLGLHVQQAVIGVNVGGSASLMGAAIWRTHIHDCYFGGNATGTHGIAAGYNGGNYPGSTDVPSTIVERCTFHDFVTACADVYGSYNSGIWDCEFQVMTAKIGIHHQATGGSRPYGKYVRNIFTTVDVTNATGINVANTPTVGNIWMVGNEFIGFASDAKCMTKRTAGYIGRNWNNGTIIATA